MGGVSESGVMETRVALNEERIGKLPDKEFVLSSIEKQNQNVYAEMGAKELRLEGSFTERIGNTSAAIRSELALDRQTLKREILVEFKEVLEERAKASQAYWTRFGIVVSALPIIIILYFVLSGTMTPQEGVAAAAGAM